jgi:ribosomal protein S18 acetylase RimI-like enzyme
MKIEPFRTDDIVSFLQLAATENWVAEPWEFEFLLSEFSQGCFTARKDNGEITGYVTSLRHERGGWIGNLIVDGNYRGRGIGEKLFTRSLEALRSAGVETVWLTASKSGQALYEKHSFKSVDTIIRWVGTGRQCHTVHERSCGIHSVGSPLVGSIDCRAWGDRREALLAATVGRGTLLHEDSGFVVIQPCGNAQQFGPFTALDSDTAECLLDAALHRIPLGSKIYLDSPASNRAALRMFNRRRLRIAGTTELMYAGLCPDYRPELLYGLATMGSCG